jgi:ArsR family transcriptional regulator, arsenate/arsenite/antimonite-responsive transcriptional repressor
MEKIRETLLALSDTTRLRALALMAEEGEVCVCELVAALGEVQPKISRHLAVLRDAGIVTTRKDARWIHHTIAPDLDTWARDAVTAAVAGVSAEPIHQRDRTRLKKMTGRPPRDKAVCPVG